MSFKAKAIYVVVTSLFLLAFAIPLVGLAQREGLEEFLGRVDEKVSSINSLSASFVQTRETGLAGQKMEAKGRLYLSKPRRVLLDYDEPERQKLLIDGSVVTIYVPSLKQAQRFDLGGRQEESNLFVFWEPMEKLREQFSIAQIRQKGTRLRYVELSPKEGANWTGLKRVVLGIDPQLLLPSFIEAEEVGGDRVKMTLSDIKANPKLDNATFELKLPPGVEVIDYSEELGAAD